MWRFSKNLRKDRPLDENRIHNVILCCSVLWLHRQFWGSWNTIFAERLLTNSKFLTNMTLLTAHDVTSFYFKNIYTAYVKNQGSWSILCGHCIAESPTVAKQLKNFVFWLFCRRNVQYSSVWRMASETKKSKHTHTPPSFFFIFRGKTTLIVIK